MKGILLLIGLLQFQAAQAVPEVSSLLAPSYGEISDYQVGDTWGKASVFESRLPELSKVYQRAAIATGYISVGGTGFYLGKFAGQHVVATNHHVCPKASECEGQKIDFRLLHRVYRIKKQLQTLPNVDLTLLTVDVPAADEDRLREVGRMFAFGQHTYPGQPLITIGFGVAGNPHNYMMGTSDADCKVFSGRGQYKHLADPDKYNPVSYRAWSFAHGCDMSHGDSGSAMIDRRNGAVVGIIWTGRIPKLKKTQVSSNLTRMLNENSPAIWTELNYAVSSVKIGEALYEESHNISLPRATKEIYTKMLQAGKGTGAKYEATKQL